MAQISPDDRARFQRLFANAQPNNGLLDGDKARDIFVKSRLPLELLARVWQLADTRQRGSLDSAEFVLAMHLIQRAMAAPSPEQAAAELPQTLPPALFAQAAGLPPPATSGGAPAPPLQQQQQQQQAPSQQLQPQVKGMAPTPPMPQAPTFMAAQPTGVTAQTAPASAGGDWAISAAEKAQSDQYFDGLDVERSGVLAGDRAVPFFMASALPEHILAKIWDLADVRGQGALTKDEFAIAMHLVFDAKQGRPVPDQLPSQLVPPSLRAPQAAAPGPQRDLLSLMDDDDDDAATTTGVAPPGSPPPPGTPSRRITQQPLAPQPTGGSSSALRGTIFPQHTGAGNTPVLSPQSTGTPVLQPHTSVFASPQRALSPQATGVKSTPQQTSSTFFDDNDDDDHAEKLSADKSRLASLEREHEAILEGATSAADRRQKLERALAETRAAIDEVNKRLEEARQTREDERTRVDELEKRSKDQKDVLGRARHQLIAAESDLSALRVERQELEGAYLRDKEDVRALEKDLARVQHETQEMRTELEQKRKESRQQKGRTAIAKKQLATAETEREKVAQELAAPIEEERDETAVAASMPLPMSPAISPPVATGTSTPRSTNPFDMAIPAAVGGMAAGAGGAAALAATSTEESDPFGMGQPEAPKDNAAFDAAFADSFGDDFSSAPVPAAAPVNTNFDEAFADIDDAPAPAAASSEPAPEIVAAVPGAEPAPAAAAEEQVKEPAPAAVDEPAVEEPAAAEAEPIPTSTPAADGDSDSSSDDEGPVEEADAVYRPSSAPREPSQTSVKGGSSDTGSFVHVHPGASSSASTQPESSPAPATESTEAVAEPATEDMSEPVSDTTVEPVIEPPAEPTVAPEVESEVATSETPEPVMTAEPAADPVTAEPEALGTTPPAAPAAMVDAPPQPVRSMTGEKRRAAPPPPAARSSSAAVPAVQAFDSSLSSPFAANSGARSATHTPDPPISGATAAAPSNSAPAHDDFDDAFGDMPPPSSAAGKSTDFDDAFGDMPPPSNAAPGKASDFDSSFDNDFTFKEGFDAPAPAPQSQSGADAFDASFADFDSAFEPKSPQGQQSSSAAMSFDDAFGFGGDSSSSRAAPPPPPPRRPSAQDSDDVQRIVAMGFTREQAKAALAKHKDNVEEAVNSLLG